MRWRPPAHPCPAASSFFITVLIACRMGGFGGRFHVYGWALCWYVICVTVVHAMLLLLYMCTCACLWSDVYVCGGALTKVALHLYFCRHGLSSLRVPEAHGLANEPMIRDPPYLCSPQCLPPSCHTEDAGVHCHTQLLHAVGEGI